MAGDGANGHPDSPKAVPAAQTRHSLSGRLRDAFQHDSAACSHRVVESRCGRWMRKVLPMSPDCSHRYLSLRLQGIRFYAGLWANDTRRA